MGSYFHSFFLQLTLWIWLKEIIELWYRQFRSGYQHKLDLFKISPSRLGWDQFQFSGHADQVKQSNAAYTTRVLRGRKEVTFLSEWSCSPYIKERPWRYCDGWTEETCLLGKFLNDSQQYSRNLTQEIFLSVDSHVSDWRVTSCAVHLSFGLNAIFLRRITCILSEGLELDSTCPTHLSTVYNVRPLLPANYFGDDLLSFSATQWLEWKQSAAGEGHRGWAAAKCKDQWTEVATFAFLHIVEGTKSPESIFGLPRK